MMVPPVMLLCIPWVIFQRTVSLLWGLVWGTIGREIYSVMIGEDSGNLILQYREG